MANITKWVLKSKNNSLQTDEEILASLGAAVQNKVKYMAVSVFAGGVAGGALAGLKLKQQEYKKSAQPVSSIEKYPHGAVILALTQTRLLVYKLNFLGRPKSLGASYARDTVANVEMETKKINNALTLTFTDGGKVTHDVSLAQGDELKKFVDLINDKK